MSMSDNRKVLLVVDTTNTYQRKIIRGVATYAQRSGNWDLHVMQDPLENLPYLKQDPLEGLRHLDVLQANGVLAVFNSRTIASAVGPLTVPVVGIEVGAVEGGASLGIPNFATDNEAIGHLAAEDLIGRGFKRLAFCGIPHTRFTAWSNERWLAFRQCAQEAGVPCSAFAEGGRQTRKRGQTYKQLLAWLESLEKPVGLMACYDVRARHVLVACRALGLLVPEEVAVIGVDNDEMICELCDPPLSSIEQGARSLGHQAAALLDKLISGKKASRLEHRVKPEGIVTRRSSDMLAIEDTDVADAIRFIRRHACDGMQIQDIVDNVQVSRSTLEAHFKAVIGRTIHAEVQRVQIERVKQLVATTDLPLKQVAAKAGFKYVQHMTTVFRQHTGQTPAEYRKRLGA